MPYSKKLNQQYEKTETGVLFEDGTGYTKKEMKLIMDLSDNELQKVHVVKKMFHSEVVK